MAHIVARAFVPQPTDPSLGPRPFRPVPKAVIRLVVAAIGLLLVLVWLGKTTSPDGGNWRAPNSRVPTTPRPSADANPGPG